MPPTPRSPSTSRVNDEWGALRPSPRLETPGRLGNGDLRRLILNEPDTALRRKVAEVMTPNPKRIRGEALASEAMAILRQHRIDDLPVVDEEDRPIGLIDVQDLVVLRMFDVDGST